MEPWAVHAFKHVVVGAAIAWQYACMPPGAGAAALVKTSRRAGPSSPRRQQQVRLGSTRKLRAATLRLSWLDTGKNPSPRSSLNLLR